MKLQKIVTIGITEAMVKPEYWKKIDKLAERRSLTPTDPNIFNELKDADCLLVNVFQYTVQRDVIDAAPKLKYIGVFSTAYGKVDVEYAKIKGVTVCNIPGFSTEAVAEFAFGTILEYIRDLGHSKQLARDGDLSEVPKFPIYEIKGKKFGIIGLGRIGGRIAELAKAFSADVVYWSRNKKEQYEKMGIKYQDLDKVISESDFLSINLSFNKDTENFMNTERIKKIKNGAIFLNLSPNELVDFKALEERLAKGEIVYIADHSDEMAPDLVKRLIGYKTCVIYPPLGFATKEAILLKQETLVSNVENFVNGKVMNKVN